MNTLRSLWVGAGPLMVSGAALAQNGTMMGGTWGDGWMGGYGAVWMPILLVAVVAAIVVLVMRRK